MWTQRFAASRNQGPGIHDQSWIGSFSGTVDPTYRTGMDLTDQQWTIVLRQESFNVRFGSAGELVSRLGVVGS